MHKLVDFQAENGIAGFYVGGNTGECSILPNKTRMDVLEAVMEENKGGKIIAHIGAGHFDDTCQLLEHANSCNVDAVASLPPSLTGYYNDEEAHSFTCHLTFNIFLYREYRYLCSICFYGVYCSQLS
jgi:dihydrodipicolinate synthase/N-acetylneuraminate lyase